MKKDDLKEILRQHRLWLESGQKKGARAQLQGADLRGADLQGAHLQRADFQRADLQGANLRDAILEDAHLQDANLQGAYLHGAYLQDANLQGATFDLNFKKVLTFYGATFSEDQAPWAVLHAIYPEWADSLKWVKASADAA